jgi:hypothetical protein
MSLEPLLKSTDLIGEQKPFGSAASLRRAIQDRGFPPGRLLSANVRVWAVSEVRAWLDALPSEPQPKPQLERHYRRGATKSEAAA